MAKAERRAAVSTAQPLLERPLADEQQSAGEPFPPKYEVIEVHVAGLMQLFNAIDPSPFPYGKNIQTDCGSVR